MKLPSAGIALPLALLLFGLAFAPGDAIAEPGWIMPHPPYPAIARIRHEAGTVILNVRTDKNGRVIKATASVPAAQTDDLPDLAKISVQYALASWHGPPNAKLKTHLEFMLR